MADKPSEKKGKKPPKKISPEDLEKTLLDVDARALEESLQETLIFEAPPIDEEDTDLHGKKKKLPPVEENLEGETRLIELTPEEHESLANTNPEPPLELEKTPLPPKVSQAPQQASAPTQKTPKKKPALRASAAQGNAQSIIFKVLEFLFGTFLLLLCVDLSIEGLASSSSLAIVYVLFSAFSICLSAFYVLKQGRFSSAIPITLLGFLFLMALSSWKFGSFDGEAFSLFRFFPADLYNVVFLTATLFGIYVCFRSSFSKLVKSVFVFLLLLAISPYVENLWPLLKGAQAWHLEDTLLGTPLWKWIPYYAFRPVCLGLYFIFPAFCFLLLSRLFLASTSGAEKQRTRFASVILFAVIFLGHLILFQHRIPSVFSIFMKVPLGVGKTAVYENELVREPLEIATVNLNQERLNDLARSYQMAAYFSPENKSIRLLVRDEGGGVVPFLSKKDLDFWIGGSNEKLKQLSFDEKKMIPNRSIAILIDHSSSMTASLNAVQIALQKVYALFSSRERLLWVAFSDGVESAWIKNNRDLNDRLGRLMAQGSRNLQVGFDSVFKNMSSASGERLLFWITGPDIFLSEDVLSSLSSRLKQLKIRPYLVVVGDTQVPPTLKNFAEQNGGVSLGIQNSNNIPFGLLSLFAEAAGAYQIQHGSASTQVQIQIASPQKNSEINGPTTLQFKLVGAADLKINSVKLFVGDKKLQESPVAEGQSDFQFQLDINQIPQGKQTLKIVASTAEGREFTQELPLNIKSTLGFRLIRPLQGDTVTGSVNLEAFYPVSATRPPPLRVEFLVDGQKLGEVVSEPYLFPWTAAPDGEHTLQVIAYLSDGSTLSEQVKVKVAQGLGIHFVSPAAGEFLSNLTPLEVEVAAAPDAKVSVEFFADGQKLSEVKQAPYKYLWDNVNVEGGQHVIQAKARLESGETTSDAVIVNVGTGTLSVALEGEGASTESMPGAAPSAVTVLSPDYMEWLIDASRSMNNSIGSTTKMALVKQGLLQITPKISSQTQVALRLYGSEHRAFHENCKDSVLLQPLKSLEGTKSNEMITKLEAKGVSPLGFALDKVRNDLKMGFGSKVAFLFTDGSDNCGGNPVGEIERWKKEKLNIKLYVFGLDMQESREENDLKQLAAASGGKFFNIQSEEEFYSALTEVLKINYRVYDYKNQEIAHRPVGALPLTLRTGEYRVEVDVAPPLVKDKVLINNGVEKKLILRKDGNGFNFVE